MSGAHQGPWSLSPQPMGPTQPVGRKSDLAEPELPRYARVLTESDREPLMRLLREHPDTGVFIYAQLTERSMNLSASRSPKLLGAFSESSQLLDLCWLGTNVVPLGASPFSAPFFGPYLRASGTRLASIFGPSHAVISLWHRFGTDQEPFAIREQQPLLAMSAASAIPAEPSVHVARLEDAEDLFEAGVNMFTEEVGYSPLRHGDTGYRARVVDRIRRDYALLSRDVCGRIAFKAELGNVSPQGAQISGVWVEPEHRGKGLAASCVAAVVLHALSVAPRVSLYVNSYNVRAQRVYRKVGFTQVGTFATVLF